MRQQLIEPLLARWYGLPERDQKALRWLLIALTIAIVIFGLVLPIQQKTKTLHQNLDRAQSTYDELLAIAPLALAQSGGQVASTDVNSLNTEIRRQAARYGLAIQRFEPSGDELRVWVEDVRYPSIVQWLGALEMMGIIHVDLTIEDRPKSGFVSGRITFSTAS